MADLKHRQAEAEDPREVTISNNGSKADSHDGEPQLNIGGHGATQRRLRNYQVTMIGFCSGIGTGLFVGSGAAYAKAGPAGLLLAYSIVGIILWCVMQSISELATLVSEMNLVNSMLMLTILPVTDCRIFSSLGNSFH